MINDLRNYAREVEGFSHGIRPIFIHNWTLLKEILITGINFATYVEFQGKYLKNVDRNIRGFWQALLGENFEIFKVLVEIFVLKMDRAGMTDEMSDLMISIGDFLNLFITRFDSMPFLQEDFIVVQDTLNKYIHMLNYNL
jgi:hypothetical protein